MPIKEGGCDFAMISTFAQHEALLQPVNVSVDQMLAICSHRSKFHAVSMGLGPPLRTAGIASARIRRQRTRTQSSVPRSVDKPPCRRTHRDIDASGCL